MLCTDVIATEILYLVLVSIIQAYCKIEAGPKKRHMNA